MDPRAVVHPVGPLPEGVYWRRRLVLLAALLVVVAVIAVSCSGGSSPRRGAVASGTPTPSATPSPTPSAATPAACTGVQLSITTATDATTYAAGVLPRLSMTVRNRSARTCRFADSAATRTWSIYSGADLVWSNAGCAASPALTERTLAPGAAVRHTYVWNRHRSGPNCSTSTTSADPGTYRLYVAVDGQRSAPAVFHLTG